ncbi:hypothetical protein D3C75_1019070 [compost metagenome]
MVNQLYPFQHVLLCRNLRRNAAVNVLKRQLRELVQILGRVRTALPVQQILCTLNKLPELYGGQSCFIFGKLLTDGRFLISCQGI